MRAAILVTKPHNAESRYLCILPVSKSSKYIEIHNFIFLGPTMPANLQLEISNYVHIDARAESYNSRFITASIMGRASNLYPVVYQTSSKYSEIRNFVFLVTTMIANLKWKFLILFI